MNKTGGIQEITVYIDGIFEHSYTRNSGTIDSDKHYNTLHVMDGRSRIATVRVGTDVDDDKPAIQYFLEDHLGTACVVYGVDGLLINREEYYPFGESCFGAFAKKRYRYVGKEKDNESGLYNYGARYYAPWVCRFISIDPLADEFPFYTPYQYAGNKPINFIDLDGLEESSPALVNSPSVASESANGSDIDKALEQNQKSINAITASIEHIQQQIDNLTEFIEVFQVQQAIVSLFARLGIGEIASSLMQGPIDDALADLTTWHDSLAIAQANLAFESDRAEDLHEAREALGNTTAAESDGVRDFQIPMEIQSTASSIGYHANDRRNSRTQHGYVIRDKAGEIWEFGISGTDLTTDENGKRQSPRAQNKLRLKYLGDPNMTYEVIKEGMKNRGEAIDWEKAQVYKHGEIHDMGPRGQGRPSWAVFQRNGDRARAAIFRQLKIKPTNKRITK